MANGHGGSDGNSQAEGQLRYWTAEMCNKSPHLSCPPGYIDSHSASALLELRE